MLSLYQFPAAWDVCSASGFCAKVEAFLRWQNIPHVVFNTRSLKSAPKGKVPYIIDNGVVLGDSDLIIAYLCQKFSLNPDFGLSCEQKAIARSVQYMCEEGLYRATSYFRFVDDAGWQILRRSFFVDIPRFIRPFVEKKIRDYVRQQLVMQGIARHSSQEIAQMASLDLDALSNLLGAKSFFFGEEMHLIDITVFSVLSNIILPPFDNMISYKARNMPNLVAHTNRVRELCFGEPVSSKVAA